MHKSSQTRGIGQLPLEQRVIILSMLVEGRSSVVHKSRHFGVGAFVPRCRLSYGVRK